MDCEEEDTTRSNDFGDIRKSSKRSQSNGEAGTSKSSSRTPKKKLTRNRHDHVCRQELIIPIIIKRLQSKQGVCRKNVKDDLDFDDYIANSLEKQVEIRAFGSNVKEFSINWDNSIKEQILALNVGEQMFGLLHLKEMSPTKKRTYGIFIFFIHVPIVIIEDNFVTMDSILLEFVLLHSPINKYIVIVRSFFILDVQSNPLDCLMIFLQVEN